MRSLRIDWLHMCIICLVLIQTTWSWWSCTHTSLTHSRVWGLNDITTSNCRLLTTCTTDTTCVERCKINVQVWVWVVLRQWRNAWKLSAISHVVIRILRSHVTTSVPCGPLITERLQTSSRISLLCNERIDAKEGLLAFQDLVIGSLMSHTLTSWKLLSIFKCSDICIITIVIIIIIA